MAWGDMLVHVRAYEGWPEHIEVALRLAKDFEARLTALYTRHDVAILKRTLGKNCKAVAATLSRSAPVAAKAEQRFREALREAGVSGDWEMGEGNASELLTLAGRFHDLIIVEQNHPGFDEYGWDVAENCVMASGKPTLVIPFEGDFPTIGHRILVAWNNSRQAAAALHGALPLIERAEHVTLVIGEAKESFASITRYPKLNIVDYLGRHARDVSTYAFEARDVEAGARLLQLAETTNSDLMVMGAYGRAAWRELILGGATRHILEHMMIPVLMAH